MTGALVPLLAVAAGWGCHRAVIPTTGPAQRIVGSVAFGIALSGGWLIVLDILGISWTPPAVAAGFLAGLFLAVWPWLRWFRDTRGAVPGSRSAASLSPWAFAAVLGVGARAIAVAAIPAFGWDFRYIWGLKARVFALSGGHDLQWLARPVHAFAHTGYPPLWPDLMAAGCVAGAPVDRMAAWWGAILALGLGAACWRLARPSGLPAAALAAVGGAWFPTLLAPDVLYSGSAEPLTAFLFAAALASLGWTREGDGSPVVLATALAALALTKQEGAVLAVLLAAAAFPILPKKQRPWPVAAAVLPVATWQLIVTAAGIPRLPVNLDPARMLSRAATLPGGLLSVLSPVLLLEILVTVVILTAPDFRGARSLRLALVLWFAALGLAYLISPHGLRWHLETSLQRVLAIPLPGALALVLGAGLSGSVDSRRRGQHNAGSATSGREEAA